MLSVPLRRLDQSLLVTSEVSVEHDLVLVLQGLLPAPVQAVCRSIALSRLPQAVEEAEQSRHAAGGEQSLVETTAVVAEGVDLTVVEGFLRCSARFSSCGTVGVRGVPQRPAQGL